MTDKQIETYKKEIVTLRKRLDEKLLTNAFVNQRLFTIRHEVNIYGNKKQIKEIENCLENCFNNNNT
jgi:hypothetical protein